MQQTINIMLPDKEPFSEKKSSLYYKIDIKSSNSIIEFDLSICILFKKDENYIFFDSLNKKEKKNFKLNYNKIAKNLLKYLKRTIKSKKDLNDFLNYVNHPKIKLHKKILNTFDKNKLEIFFRKTFLLMPILNIDLFKNMKSKKPPEPKYKEIFIPYKINGWYVNGIEVTVYSNNTPFVLIEDLQRGIIIEPICNLLPIKQNFYEKRK